jgi:hypothetical protein
MGSHIAFSGTAAARAADADGSSEVGAPAFIAVARGRAGVSPLVF